MTHEATRRNYDRLSRWYDLFTSSERRFTEIGLQRLDIRAGESVLEIGFGTGHALVELAGLVGETGQVYGIDISERMLQVAQRHIHRAGLAERVELRLGDAAHLPFEDSTFDALFISFTLELFGTSEIPLMLGECQRVLRQGGRIGLVAMAEGSGLAVRLYKWGHRHWPSLLDCRPIQASMLVTESGFQDVEMTVESTWGLPVQIVTARKP